MKKGIKKKEDKEEKEKCMELIVRALFCLTRGLKPGVTDIMKVSSPALERRCSTLLQFQRKLDRLKLPIAPIPKQFGNITFEIHAACILLPHRLLPPTQLRSWRKAAYKPCYCILPREPRSPPQNITETQICQDSTWDLGGATQGTRLVCSKKVE